MDLKKIFAKDVKATEVLNIRLSKSDKQALLDMASKYAGGNTTSYIKKCCLEVVPTLLQGKK